MCIKGQIREVRRILYFIWIAKREFAELKEKEEKVDLVYGNDRISCRKFR